MISERRNVCLCDSLWIFMNSHVVYCYKLIYAAVAPPDFAINTTNTDHGILIMWCCQVTASNYALSPLFTLTKALLLRQQCHQEIHFSTYIRDLFKGYIVLFKRKTVKILHTNNLKTWFSVRGTQVHPPIAISRRMEPP